MTLFNRRNFLKGSSLTLLPPVFGFDSMLSAGGNKIKQAPPAAPIIKFYGDGETFEPADYLSELKEIQATQNIIRDRYGVGGAVEDLEKKMAAISGKESAIFMPSGTMANQLAIDVLSGENSKIFVQETSHVFRDEADATQSVFGKRLMPLSKGETFFTVQQLQSAIDGLKDEEVFKTGIGAVSIENPVRRNDGRMVPLEEIIKISKYCRSNNIKLHLDGARIFIATGWSGISVKEYASYFDTIYISLYKYFGASGGAILCGPKEIIDKMVHLVKVHGGSMYSNWANAAMAIHRMEGFENRLQNAVTRSAEVFSEINKLPGVQISSIAGGTNIFNMDLAKEINGTKVQERLKNEFSIRIGRPNENNHSQLTVNETILYQGVDYVINAFKKSTQA